MVYDGHMWIFGGYNGVHRLNDFVHYRLEVGLTYLLPGWLAGRPLLQLSTALTNPLSILFPYIT